MTAPERDTLSPRERAVDVGLAGRGNVGGDDIAFYVEAGAGRPALRGAGMNRDRRAALCASPECSDHPRSWFPQISILRSRGRVPNSTGMPVINSCELERLRMRLWHYPA